MQQQDADIERDVLLLSSWGPRYSCSSTAIRVKEHNAGAAAAATAALLVEQLIACALMHAYFLRIWRKKKKTEDIAAIRAV